MQPVAPRKWKMALLIWCFIFPLISTIFYFLSPILKELPFPLPTLCMSVILVPTMVYVILPFINKNFGQWLRK